MKILKWFFTSTTGIAAFIGLIIVIGATVAQFYYFQKPVIAKKEAIKSGGTILSKTADALEKAAKAGQKWPTRSAWFPKNLPCAATVKMNPIPPWDALGFEENQLTHFQYRLDIKNDKYVLRARTDTDCDGVFAIHTIHGTTDWTSTFRRYAATKNMKE